MILQDVIKFINGDGNGYGLVEFPTLVACSKCQGLKGIIFNREQINDPELAQQVSLLSQGYNFRVNEERANRGCFSQHNGHDGWPDDWQHVTVETLCSCAKEAQKAA
jgi:hypothetical protein